MIYLGARKKSGPITEIIACATSEKNSIKTVPASRKGP